MEQDSEEKVSVCINLLTQVFGHKILYYRRSPRASGSVTFLPHFYFAHPPPPSSPPFHTGRHI